MKKILGLVCLIYSATCFSNETLPSSSALVGDWAGQRCQSYNDSTTMGTYHFNFEANGQMFTYLQYYDAFDTWCTGLKGMTSKAVMGSYEILSSTENNGKMIYELSLHYSHMPEQPMITRALVSGNTLQLCSSSGKCSNYLKI